MAKQSSKGSGKPLPKIEINLELTPEQGEELLKTLQVRFEKNMSRHAGLEWPKIQAKLEAHPEKLSSLHAMESTGGEPDVVGYDKKTLSILNQIDLAAPVLSWSATLTGCGRFGRFTCLSIAWLVG